MHEFSIADSLLDQVIEAGKANGAVKVSEVHIDAGQLRQIVPEVMQTAWESITVGTIAQGSSLAMTNIEAYARCRICGVEFTPEVDNFVCPACSNADVDIVKGNEIILKSIDCTL